MIVLRQKEYGLISNLRTKLSDRLDKTGTDYANLAKKKFRSDKIER